jgi:tetratricopeptide (TPR) repeat protein
MPLDLDPPGSPGRPCLAPRGKLRGATLLWFVLGMTPLLSPLNPLSPPQSRAAKPAKNSASANQPAIPPKVLELQKAATRAFDARDFEGALRSLQALLSIAQDSAYEDALFRMALCHFSMGNFSKAAEGLEAFIQKFPDSPLLAEARHKLAATRFSLGEFAVALEACRSWETLHATHPLLGAVTALKGDALAALGKREEAASAYRACAEQASSQEISAYALGEACKQWQKLGRWDDCREFVTSFLQNRPGHPAELPAQEWLAAALSQLGHPDDAKRSLAQALQPHLENRTLESVEPALRRLALLCNPASSSAKTPPTPSPTPPPPPPNPAACHAELLRLLNASSVSAPLAKARVAFAEIELFSLLKKTGEADRRLNELLSETSPPDWSAPLLALAGDRFLAQGEIARASDCYSEISRTFPKSAHRLSALNGLGKIALGQEKAEEALGHFNEGLDHFSSEPGAKISALGKGHALLALKRFDEARTAFEKVASNRSWRGEATAEAVYMIGESLFQKGDPRAAVQYFQRVFVAYQHYEPIAAKSYLRAADCFEQLGSPEKALAHLREILRKKKFRESPEAEIARQRLDQAKKP